jgi:hypothetical protein
VSFGAPSPAANAAGWNNTDVSISFSATDAISGVGATTPGTSPLLLTSEGNAVSGAVQATDVAGNSVTVQSPVVKIDRTPPQITGAQASVRF